MAPKQNTVSTPQAAVQPQANNGVITGNTNPLGGAVNRKKAKRRAKEAARKSAAQEPGDSQQEYASDFVEPPRVNGKLPHRDGDTPLAYDPDPNDYEEDYVEGDPEQADYVYSDEEQYPYDTAAPGIPGAYTRSAPPPPSRSDGRGKGRPGGQSIPYHPHRTANSASHYPTPSDEALRTVQRGINSSAWNMSNADERRQIKEYWLSLGENERKSLVKIEKNDVLQKMKDQQKHSCSCTVCGRKRVAIEEELEILYDAYYKELEQYANTNQHMLGNGAAMMPPPVRPTSRSPPPSRSPPRRAHRGRIEELPEDEEELEDDEEDLDEEEYSDEEYDDDYSGDEDEHLPPAAAEFFTFGNSLTVKGGILTVADDLLKNDGQKFIDMMEQLAERRLQREHEALSALPPPHSGLGPPHSHGDHDHQPLDDEEYDDEDEEDYDSQEEDYDEEDDVDTMTEGQRMEEGRRMFQIFAARMFEQRVLDAYRQKRSEDRAALLIQELAEEEALQGQAGAKSAKKNEKKRLKEKAKKQAQKEEKARKEEERLAAIAEEEKRKQEEQKRRQEENRKKQEAKAEEKRRKTEQARLAQEEEKARKRAEDQERKAREQKLKDEKKRREEAERQEREEQERKAREEKAEAERLERAKAEQEAATKRQAEHTRVAEAAKRAPVPAVALPPTLRTKTSAGIDSPQVKVATPVLPVAPTPARNRDLASRASHNNTPQTPETASHVKQPTPPSRSSTQQSSQQNSMSRARTPAQSTSYTPQMSPMHGVAPPPGMSTPLTGAAGMNMATPGGFAGIHSPMMPGSHRSPLGPQTPGFSPHSGPIAPQQRQFMPGNVNGPPGIMSHNTQPTSRFFLSDPMQSPASSFKSYGVSHPPGFSQNPVPSRENIASHTRQPSMSASAPLAPSMDSSSAVSPGHPIGRPAPIGRPSLDVPHARPKNTNADVDELGARLGSSALLDDNDEPLPTPAADNRRVSAPFGMPTFPTRASITSNFDHAPSPFGQSLPNDTWRPSPSTFGPPGLASASGWGQAAPGAGWGAPSPFPAALHRLGSLPRPVSVRILAAQACRMLGSQSAGVEGGFFEFNDMARQSAEIARANHETAPLAPELMDILDTEGDTQNGGGHFIIKEDKVNRRLLVKWQADGSSQSYSARPNPGIGEIGSPMANNSLPTFGPLGSRAF